MTYPDPVGGIYVDPNAYVAPTKILGPPPGLPGVTPVAPAAPKAPTTSTPRSSSGGGGGSTVTYPSRYIQEYDDLGNLWQIDTADGSRSILQKAAPTPQNVPTNPKIYPVSGTPTGYVYQPTGQVVNWDGSPYNGPGYADGRKVAGPADAAALRTQIVQTADGSDVLVDLTTGKIISTIGGPTAGKAPSSSGGSNSISSQLAGYQPPRNYQAEIAAAGKNDIAVAKAEADAAMKVLQEKARLEALADAGDRAAQAQLLQQQQAFTAAQNQLNRAQDDLDRAMRASEFNTSSTQRASEFNTSSTQRAYEFDTTNAQRAAESAATAEDRRQDNIRQVRDQYLQSLSSVDPTAFRAFLKTGGGNIWNAMTSGAGSALSDAALYGGAAALSDWRGLQAGGGGTPATAPAGGVATPPPPASFPNGGLSSTPPPAVPPSGAGTLPPASIPVPSPAPAPVVPPPVVPPPPLPPPPAAPLPKPPLDPVAMANSPAGQQAYVNNAQRQMLSNYRTGLATIQANEVAAGPTGPGDTSSKIGMAIQQESVAAARAEQARVAAAAAANPTGWQPTYAGQLPPPPPPAPGTMQVQSETVVPPLAAPGGVPAYAAGGQKGPDIAQPGFNSLAGAEYLYRLQNGLPLNVVPPAYANGGLTREPQFMVGDSVSGRPTGHEEVVVNPTGAPLSVIPMDRYRNGGLGMSRYATGTAPVQVSPGWYLVGGSVGAPRYSQSPTDPRGTSAAVIGAKANPPLPTSLTAQQFAQYKPPAPAATAPAPVPAQSPTNPTPIPVQPSPAATALGTPQSVQPPAPPAGQPLVSDGAGGAAPAPAPTQGAPIPVPVASTAPQPAAAPVSPTQQNLVNAGYVPPTGLVPPPTAVAPVVQEVRTEREGALTQQEYGQVNDVGFGALLPSVQQGILQGGQTAFGIDAADSEAQRRRLLSLIGGYSRGGLRQSA